MERISCDCASCKGACKNRPGWLQYGDEKKIADFMGITVKELFDRHLIIDHCIFDEATNRIVYILSPCPKHLPPGTIMPWNPNGVCTFLTDEEKCSIHAVSPLECQLAIHTMPNKEVVYNHLTIGRSWDNEEAQKLIADLYGKVPQVQAPTIFDHLEMMSSFLRRMRP